MNGENRFGIAVGLLMKCADYLETYGPNSQLFKELDEFIKTVHPLECGPMACTERPAGPEGDALLPGLKAALDIAEQYLGTNDAVRFLRNDIKDAILKCSSATSRCAADLVNSGGEGPK